MEKIKFNLIKSENIHNVLSLLTKLGIHSDESYIHSIDVAERALTLAIDIGITGDELSTLYTASLLHDIGKLDVSAELLHKKNATDVERELIRKQHIEGTRRILERLFSEEIVELASHHHERLNCSGYPENLNGKKLGTLDRILQVADVTSALLMNRSYQEAFKPEQATEILERLVRRGELDKKCVLEIEKLYLSEQNQPE